MCLEVYHPTNKIVVRYENEVLEFVEDQKIRASYILLVRNDGNDPLSNLYCLYPRPLYFVDDDGDWSFSGVGLSKSPITLLGGRFDPASNVYTLNQPNPNRPQTTRDGISGSWLPQDSKLDLNIDLPSDAFEVLSHYGVCFFKIEFDSSPILPGESRWFVIEAEVSGMGHRFKRSVLGTDVVVHQFASPYDVRRTTEEILETAEMLAQSGGDQSLVALFVEIKSTLGLTTPRQVDIEYYELVVFPGPQSDRLLIDWHPERDLRMRSNSPRIDDTPGTHRGEFRYEWKSGSLLEPDGYPWKSEGFLLHLTLACKPKK